MTSPTLQALLDVLTAFWRGSALGLLLAATLIFCAVSLLMALWLAGRGLLHPIHTWRTFLAIARNLLGEEDDRNVR